MTAVKSTGIGVVIKEPFKAPLDLAACFPTQAAKTILKRFKDGAKLVNWNWSMPAMWHIESPSRPGHETHLAGREADGRYATGQIVQGLLRMASSAGTSDGFVPDSWEHRKSGKPGKEWFFYDAEKERKTQEQWAEFVRIYAQWHAVTVPFAYAPEELSPFALALLRLLKTRAPLPFPELYPAFKELRMQGLLNLNEYGMFHLLPAAHKVKVPRGPKLRIFNQPSQQELAKAVRQGVLIVN